MPHPQCYQIEIRGRATRRTLHPVIDDFTIDTTEDGNTVLTGEIRDPAHLNGLLSHFTSTNVEVVALERLDDRPSTTDHPSSIDKAERSS